MSRRGNNVRGPTSALTEFLRESGITATTIARRARQVAENSLAGVPAGANGTQAPEVPAQNEAGGSGANGHDGAEEVGYDSENLDESEAETPSPKKRKLSKKAMEKQKATKGKAAKGKGKGKGKSKKKGGDDDDEGYEESEDEYTALSRNMFNVGTSSSKPPVGSFEDCAKCEKQFTVTRYTVAANPPPGWLCHDCAKASGADPFKKPAVPRKRKAPEEKRKPVSFEQKEFPSLASMCIKLISGFIEDVEALGDIGAVNLYEIARVLAKNRSLNPNNSRLFYDIKNSTLTFHDATSLDPDAFCTLASLNPGLKSLRLDYCGRINCVTLNHWASHFPSLTRLELLGPFLVRIDAWKSFFKSHPQLTGFLITQSPRFNTGCMESLAQHCPSITELRLAQVGLLSDEFLPQIATFKNLTYLDLSEPKESLSDEAVITLLEAVGSTLTHLNLSNHEFLTAGVLNEGIKPHARSLHTLLLSDLQSIEDEGMTAFFSSWTDNPPLHHISLRRNHTLSGTSLLALLDHSGRTLTELDINGWKTVSEEALTAIGTKAPGLRKVDVGWCRNVDDFVVKSILDGCESVRDVGCFGCNRLTDQCPRKHGVNIRGVETHTV